MFFSSSSLDLYFFVQGPPGNAGEVGPPVSIHNFRNKNTTTRTLQSCPHPMWVTRDILNVPLLFLCDLRFWLMEEGYILNKLECCILYLTSLCSSAGYYL